MHEKFPGNGITKRVLGVIVKMPANVNTEKCDGCEICVDECATQSIIMDGKVAVVNKETCVGCETCYDLCPSEAISMVV